MHRERTGRHWTRAGGVAESGGPGGIVPQLEELSPGMTPWEVCLRLAHLPNVLFLDSADPHPTLGRYSFVTADPFDRISARGTASGDPFEALAGRMGRLPV